MNCIENPPCDVPCTKVKSENVAQSKIMERDSIKK